jgi:hypothetical protein
VKVLPKAFHMGGKGEVMGESRIERGEGDCVGDTGRMSSLDGTSAVRGESVVEGMVYLAADGRVVVSSSVLGRLLRSMRRRRGVKSQLAYCSAVKDEMLWVDEGARRGAPRHADQHS